MLNRLPRIVCHNPLTEATHNTTDFWHIRVPANFLTTAWIVYRPNPCCWQSVLRGLCVVFKSKKNIVKIASSPNKQKQAQKNAHKLIERNHVNLSFKPWIHDWNSLCILIFSEYSGKSGVRSCDSSTGSRSIDQALICKYRCNDCVNTKRLVSMKTESITNNSRCWWIETTDKRGNQLSTIWDELMNWSSIDKNLRNIQAQYRQRPDRGHYDGVSALYNQHIELCTEKKFCRCQLVDLLPQVIVVYALLQIFILK